MSIIFPNLDFSSFSLVVNPQNAEIVLQNKQGVVIDRSVHTLLTEHLRTINGIEKNTEKGFDDITRDVMIESDRDEAIIASRKK